MRTELLPDTDFAIQLPDGSVVTLSHSTATDDVIIQHSKPRHPDTDLPRMPLYYPAPCPTPQ